MKSMRFRVWSNDRKQFVNPDNYVLELTGGLKQIELIKDEFYKPEYPDDPPVEYTEILTHLQSSVIFAGQYTGLKDKNGKEIYEGDVVTWEDSIADDMYGAGTIHPEEPVEFKGGAFYPVCTMPGEEYEIIGNIYENPELLK